MKKNYDKNVINNKVKSQMMIFARDKKINTRIDQIEEINSL